MTAAHRRGFRIVAGALFALAFSLPASALERAVIYNGNPFLSEAEAAAVCRTFKFDEDSQNRILRFICTRKLLYVCSRGDAFLSTDPEAGAQCFIERARNSD